ncbi:MAG: hypothetical protein FWD68_00800 [Alphaproteobacteria bacterium]|nr:hypothetical protein [Alphaproteobacteria bacterium]
MTAIAFRKEASGGAEEWPPPRPSSGGFDDELEKQIKAASAVRFFAICKRLQYLIPLRSDVVRKPRKTSCRRRSILERVAFHAVYDELLDLPWRRSDHRLNADDRLGMMTTVQKEERPRGNWSRFFVCPDLTIGIERWAACHVLVSKSA